MKTSLASLTQLMAILSALLFLLNGCTSTPAPVKDVTLSLNSATLQHSGNYYLLTCTAVLDNRTGETLFVTTNFDSPFDHLRPIIYDEQGHLLHDGNDTNKTGFIFDHRSPYHLGKSFPLNTGRSTNELRFLLSFTGFPISTYTVTNHPTVNVGLAGFLNGSTYHYRLKSSPIPATAATSEAKPKPAPPSWLWQKPSS